MLGYNSVNDRILTVRIWSKPANTTIIQIYAPTSNATEVDVDEFYSKLQDTVDKCHKGDMLILLGDFNAKVGNEREGKACGRFGLGVRNEAGDKLVEFCQANQLMIGSTWFKQHERRLFTWTSPGGTTENQIDYIIVQRRWASALFSVKTLPGADCGTDHELLIGKIKVKLRKKKRNDMAGITRYDTEIITSSYTIEIQNRFSQLEGVNVEPDD